MRTSYAFLVFLLLLLPVSNTSAEGAPIAGTQASADTSDPADRGDFSSGIFLRALIRFYQVVISPQDIPACRFRPTCSEFGALSIKRYGPIIGTLMTFDRLQRCHPFIGSGDYPLSEDRIHFYDPPERHLLWRKKP